jgi:predicted transcriptional regulator
MAAMPVKWKVKEYLQAHNLTPYRFWLESGLAKGTAYRLVNGVTNNLNNTTLDATIRALRSLTGEPVTITDVLEYHEKGD